MSKVLIIGAGGVGGVVAHKAAMEKQVFSDVMLASRRIAPVEKLVGSESQCSSAIDVRIQLGNIFHMLIDLLDSVVEIQTDVACKRRQLLIEAIETIHQFSGRRQKFLPHGLILRRICDFLKTIEEVG